MSRRQQIYNSKYKWMQRLITLNRQLEGVKTANRGSHPPSSLELKILAERFVRAALTGERILDRAATIHVTDVFIKEMKRRLHDIHQYTLHLRTLAEEKMEYKLPNFPVYQHEFDAPELEADDQEFAAPSPAPDDDLDTLLNS